MSALIEDFTFMAFAQTLELFSRKRGTYTSDLGESITACRLMRKGVREMTDFMKRRPLYGLVAAAALMTACAASPQADDRNTGGETGSPVTVEDGSGAGSDTATTLAPFSASGNRSMDAWREDFASRAVAAGRDPGIVHATLEGINPLELYLGGEAVVAKTGVADQAEFAKPIWEYVASAVTDGRKTRGADRLSEMAGTFDRIEAVYNVDREAITAIWAMETNLGSYIGNFDAANTLSNMAVEGRRQTFAESELIALMKMQERGEVSREDLTSGWAGAMGQTQFMPSTFLTYAVDFDGDGKKDLWNSEADALASAANYLRASGYQKDLPWGVEVLAPTDFDWSLADGEDRRLSTWTSYGLSTMTGAGFGAPDTAYAELWLPTGATGPKYLLFKNFDVFKTYNRSDSYAFSVGLLTDGVAGQNGPVAVWPTELELLSRRDVMVLQDNLNALGFDAGPVDGIAGRGTKGALRRFQKANSIVPADGYPTTVALDQVLAAR
ncbi:MAG: lytic murein transglycosylase [Pseudomonadota bacterium]